MNKTCKKCNSEFEITSGDLDFYKKVEVPEPKLCADCRLQRRLSFCNTRSLYKRKCDMCGEDMISMYHSDHSFPVYCASCFRSDKWDPLKYERDFDFSRPFFEQFKELKDIVPRVALIQQGNMEGSEYTNRASNNKNCYLIFRANFNEGCLYSNPVWESTDCMDCFNVVKCQLTYSSIDCTNCYNVQYCQESKDCQNSYFLYNCRNCQDCFGCTNLQNKQYCIFNKKYSKEDYLKKLEQLQLNNYMSLEGVGSQVEQFLKKNFRRYMVSVQADGCTGNWLEQCKSTFNSYGCKEIEDSKNVLVSLEVKDSMDYTYFGRGCELVYEGANVGYNCSKILFANECWVNCSDLLYCDSCITSCRDLVGCVGMEKNQYCILNKQYTKEEFIELKRKIIEHMKNTEEYGEFFPEELSPFAYNETEALDFFPLEKDQAKSWRDQEDKDYQITKEAFELPATIGEVDDSILKEIIGCAHEAKCNDNCTKGFRIIPQELALYRKMNIPIPRLCPNCRHYGRHNKRNPLKLWKRQCDCDYEKYNNTVKHSHHESGRCPNEFETSYSPDRSEIIYCEDCYNKEVV